MMLPCDIKNIEQHYSSLQDKARHQRFGCAWQSFPPPLVEVNGTVRESWEQGLRQCLWCNATFQDYLVPLLVRARAHGV